MNLSDWLAANLKSDPKVKPYLKPSQIYAAESLTHGKMTLMAESFHKFIKEHPQIGAKQVFIVGVDGKMHHMAQATDLQVKFAASFDLASEQYSKSWIYGSIGSSGPPKTTAPEKTPQLQPIFERLTELAEEMPFDPGSELPMFFSDIKLKHLESEWYEHAFVKQSKMPSFTFNGLDFPGEDIEHVTQTTTEEGWPRYTIKIKPQAYDKWVQMLGAGKKLPFKMEAP